MTERSNEKKTWSAKPNWIKDVLNKSGTDLVDITKAKAKTTQKKTNAKGKRVRNVQERSRKNFERPQRSHLPCAILFWYTQVWSVP